MSPLADPTAAFSNDVEPLGLGLDYASRNEAHTSAISWAAILAGAFVTAALSLILLALGAGAGLSSLSPWSANALRPSEVGTGALVWMCAMQLIAGGIGGYLAGRLRTKWVNVHSHEVYFRDTAHGFLSWAVALVMTAAFLSTAAASMAGRAIQSSGNARSDEPAAASNEYFVDQLFRTEQTGATADPQAARAEFGAILAHALTAQGLSADDKNYLAGTIASRTGLSRPDAEHRVMAVFAQAQDAANAARKAVAHALYWLFLAMLIGAFSASVAATFGGRSGIWCRFDNQCWCKSANRSLLIARIYAIDSTADSWCADSHHSADRDIQPLLGGWVERYSDPTRNLLMSCCAGATLG